MLNRRHFVVATMLCVALFIGACDKGDNEAAVHPEVAAQTVIVQARPFTQTVGAIGTVTGRPGSTARLSAPVQARIASVLVAVGQHVQRGEALIGLDQTSFVSNYEASAAALSTAQQNYTRTKRLVDAGILPRKDLDQAASELAQARSSEAIARRQQQLSVLRAPISGVVTSVSAVLGGSADPNQPLVEIADPSRVDVVLNVTPAQAAQIKTGAKVWVTAGQSASGEQIGVATVSDIAGTVDTLTRSVTVRAHAPTTTRPLRIGETVFGQIEIATHPTALVIPAAALVPEGNSFRVYVVDQNGIAHAREVTIGGRKQSEVEILSGLSVGERIVSEGAYGVEDSAKIVAPRADSAVSPGGK
jgi:membrane fusion protein (multidrug efflux system)